MDTKEKMDVSWLLEAPPESRVRLLFLINSGDPLECCEGFTDECKYNALAAQSAAINSLKKNTFEDIDNELRKRVTAILSSDIKPIPHGTPCGEHQISKDEIDFLVLYSACKYLKIQIPLENTVNYDVVNKNLNFSEKEIKSLLPLDAEKLQYIEVAQLLDISKVWTIWENVQNDTAKIFNQVITLTKPKNEALKEALFLMIVRQLQIKVKINRIYTGKLASILKNCNVDKAIIHRFRCYPQAVNPSGFCIIFSVLENRKGAEAEIEKVSDTFKSLGFIVHDKLDPKLEDIENMRVELNKPKYMFYNSLVCWFISHGDSEKIMLKDVDIDRISILQKFTNLKNFNKKPKIIFMASCLGNKHFTIQLGKGYYVKTDAKSGGLLRQLSGPEDFINITEVNNEMDLLVAYSTLDYHYAYRSEEEGSVYVDRVCHLLKQDENRGRNITEVLEETTQELHQILFHDEENASKLFVKQGSKFTSHLQKTFKVPSVNNQIFFNNDI